MTEARKFAEAKDADGNTVLSFMGPARSDDALSHCLRILTHQLKLKQPEADHGGGLFGGAYGYGVAFENDVFMMHPFCWCQRWDCPWCRDCGCEGHYDTPSGTYADGAKWILDKECVNCQEPRPAPAPNFHHKPSGLQVRWYKYIGRGMEIEREPSTAITLRAMFTEVLASIGGPSFEDAYTALADAEDREHEDMRKSFEFFNSDEGRKVMQDMLDSGAVQVTTRKPTKE